MESLNVKIIAKKVIITPVQVFLSGFFFKNMALKIAEGLGAIAIITSVFATLVF
jgi:hypothetical protein